MENLKVDFIEILGIIFALGSALSFLNSWGFFLFGINLVIFGVNDFTWDFEKLFESLVWTFNYT